MPDMQPAKGPQAPAAQVSRLWLFAGLPSGLDLLLSALAPAGLLVSSVNTSSCKVARLPLLSDFGRPPNHIYQGTRHPYRSLSNRPLTVILNQRFLVRSCGSLSSRPRRFRFLQYNIYSTRTLGQITSALRWSLSNYTKPAQLSLR